MNTEIEWTDDGKSIEYWRSDALLIMAATTQKGTVWQRSDGDKYPRLIMRKIGQLQHLNDPEAHAAMHGDKYVCLGCSECYPDAPNSEECPDCGRPLDPYPRYWRHEDTAYRVDSECEDWYWESSTGVWEKFPTPGTTSWGRWMDREITYERITPAEAQRLREEALYPRVFVATNENALHWLWSLPSRDSVICDQWDRRGQRSKGTITTPESKHHYEVTKLITPQELLEGMDRRRCSLCKGKGSTGKRRSAMTKDDSARPEATFRGR